MKKLSLLFTTLILLLSACSKDSEGLKDILSRVPADATMVGAVNIKSLFEKTDSKVSGNKVELSSQFSSYLASLSGGSEIIATLKSGKHGLKIDHIGFFSIGSKTYILGPLENEKEFKASIEKEYKVKFSEKDGVLTAGNWAVCDGYFWTSTSSLPADRIKDFSSQKESASWASKKYVETLEEKDEDFFLICSVSEISSLLGNSMQAQMISMGTNLMFNGLEYLSLNLDFEKDKLDIDLNFLTSSLAPAEYLLPMQGVDTALIQEISADASVVGAVSIPAALVEKFNTILEMAGGDAAAIKSINGTFALASADGKGSGVIQLNDIAQADAVKPLLSEIISKDLSFSPSGSNLRFSFTEPSQAGEVPINNPAALFKDALAGVVVSQPYIGIPDAVLACAMLKPEDKSVKLDIALTFSKNTSANSLINLISGIMANKSASKK